MDNDESPAKQPESGAGAGDEFEIHVEPLHALDTRSRHPTSRKLVATVSLILACVLAGIGVVRLFSALRATHVSMPTPIPTTSRVNPSIASVTPVPAIPNGQGWVPTGPPDAQMIAFASSAPATAYICGAPTLTVPNRPVPISLGVSQDRGRTWQRLSTPAIAVGCDLTIDPTNPQDIVLAATLHFWGTPPVSLYRSFDGGHTWSQWALPALADHEGQNLAAYSWAWVSSTLFLAPALDDGAGYIRLAASVAGQPFEWVEQNGLFTGAPSDARINELLATSTALYVILYRQVGCPQTCTRVMRTSDSGASWSSFAATFRGYPVYLLASDISGDGTSLFGQIVLDVSESSRTYLRSTDGGGIWTPLPPFPGQLIAEAAFLAPDGTIYAELDVGTSIPTAPPAIYALETGETTWRTVAAYPGGAGSIELAWDGHGHPVALWGRAHPYFSSQIQPGIELHTP